MSNDLNRCEFIGRLGRAPEVKYSSDGAAITSFSIACGWKTKDKEGVEWINVSAFGKLAEICNEYLTKGKQVYVAGRWNTQKWQDRETGQDRQAVRLVLDQMQMLGGRDGAEGAGGSFDGGGYGGSGNAPAPRQPRPAAAPQPRSAPAQSGGGVNLSDMDDDIPF